ncbi:trypsin-like peptidase domain-containing protein [Micromonospora sp. LOL_024]|uniref:S1 family peptidase n=1 Tax=Micromonospora sp. LOL_024 TaxID=3345412 RepID=UPI003A86C095
MQPEGPYRYTHLLGGSPVGKAWAAIDGQGRLVTVAVLDATVAATAGWREAFAGMANNLAQTTGGAPFTYADFSAAAPWVAYSAESGPAAEKLFRALEVDYQPVPTVVPQPISGPPQPVSGAPQAASLISPQPVYPDPVSGAPTSPDRGPSFDDPFAAQVRRIKPSAPPKRQTGLWIAVSVLFLVAAVGGGAGIWAVAAGEPDTAPTVGAPTATPPPPGLKPWAAAAPRSAEEHALATVAPSMVFLEAILTGYVRGGQDDTLLHPEPFTFSRRCSGVVVNHDGHVLTNGQCVQPTSDILREHALDALAKALVADGTLKADDVQRYVRTRLASTAFTGPEPGTEPDSRLFAQLNVAVGDLTENPAIPGSVIQALSLAEGNLALVKLDQGELPAAELNNSATIASGTSLQVLGYGTADTAYRSATYTVLSAPVRVTEVDIESSAYQISEDVGAYSRGGIAIDPQGRVVGMLDNDLLQPNRPNRLVVPVSRMSELLSAAGVENSLAEPDRLYRSALDAYFAGDETGAAPQLTEVVERSPTNVLAQMYREAAVAAGGDEPSRPGWVVPLLVAAAAALVGGIGTLAWSRLRMRQR